MNRGGLYYAAGGQRKRSCRRRGESGSEGFVAPGHQSVCAGQRIESTKGIENTLTAVIAHRDLAGFKVEWVRAGVVVSTDTTYTFKENQVGVFPITITASNEDGETKKELEIEVVENMPYEVVFPAPSYEQSVSTRYTFAGRPVFLRPLLDYFENPQYRWSIDGKPVEGETGRVYKFTLCPPENTG